MTSTFLSKDPYDITFAPPGLVTKETNHPFSVMLIGVVVAVQWSGDRLLLYYEDGHKAYVQPTRGELQVGDYEVPTC